MLRVDVKRECYEAASHSVVSWFGPGGCLPASSLVRLLHVEHRDALVHGPQRQVAPVRLASSPAHTNHTPRRPPAEQQRALALRQQGAPPPGGRSGIGLNNIIIIIIIIIIVIVIVIIIIEKVCLGGCGSVRM